MDDPVSPRVPYSEQAGLVLCTVVESIRTGEYRRFVETLRPVETTSESPEPKEKKLLNGADAAAAGLVLEMLQKGTALLIAQGKKTRNETSLGTSGTSAETYGRMFTKAYETLDAAHLAAPIPGWELGYRVHWLPERGQVVLTIEVFRLDPGGHVIGTPMTSVREVEAALPSVDPVVRRGAEALRGEVALYLQRLRALETARKERYPRTFDELWQPRRLAYRTHVRESVGVDADILSPRIEPDPLKQLLRRAPTNDAKQDERAWSEWRQQVRRGIIISRAGVGKTWIVRHEASVRASEGEVALAAGADAVPFPVVVPLDEFAAAVGAGKDPFEAVVDTLRRRFALSDAFFNHARQQLELPHAFVIFDGLDLVTTNERATAEEALAAFSVNSQAGILLMCRTDAYDRAPFALVGLEEELVLLPFDAGDVEQFVDTWFGADMVAAAALQRRIDQEPGTRVLAEHPLSLAFLCTLAGREPLSAPMRASLYESVLLMYLDGQGRGARSGSLHRGAARTEAKFHVLQEVAHALAISRTGWNYRFSTRDVVAAMRTCGDQVRAIVDKQETLTAVDHLLDEFLIEDGVFRRSDTGDIPGAGARYEFFHGSVHEFLVAKYLAEMPEADWLRAIDEHRWEGRGWEEVIVLLAQLVPNADPLITRLLAEPEDAFHAMLLLAARCVAEARANVGDTVCGGVIDRLITLLDAPSVFDVDRSGRALIAMRGAPVPALRAAIREKKNNKKYGDAERLEHLLFQIADASLLDFYKEEIGRENRKDAAIAIGKAGDPRGIELLVDGLRRWDDYHARDGEYAVRGLAEIPDRRAVWELIGIACGNFKRLESHSWGAHAWWLLSSARPRRVMKEDGVLRRTVETLTDLVARFGLAGLQFAVAQTARPKSELTLTWSRYGPRPRVRCLAFGSEAEISESLQAIAAATHRLHNPSVEALRAIYGDFDADADDRRLAAKLLVAAAPPEQIEALLWGEVTSHLTGKPYHYLEDFVLDALVLTGRSEYAPALRRLLGLADGELSPNDRLRVARRLFSLDPAQGLLAVEELLVEGQGYEHERLATAEEVLSATGNRTLLVTVLLQIVATGEEKAAISAAERLASLGATEAIPRLRWLLRCGDGYEHDGETTHVEVYAERRASAVALGLMGACEATNDLINALRDPDSIARKAAEALGRIADRATTEPLQDALQRRGVVELAAIVALRKIGDLATVETWIQRQAEILLHERPFLHRPEGTLVTIAAVGTPSALRTLTTLAESAEDAEVRCKAVTALGAYPSREQLLRAAVSILQRTSETNVRSVAAKVIRKWRGRFVVELLLALFDARDTTEEAKEAATSLLDYMDVTGFAEPLARALETCPRRSFFRLAYLAAQVARGTTAIWLAERILAGFAASDYKTTTLRRSAGSYELLMMLASEIRRSAPADWPTWQSRLSETTASVSPSAFARSSDN